MPRLAERTVRHRLPFLAGSLAAEIVTSNGLFAVTMDASGPEIVSHELGHALFNLADEYDYGGSPPCAHDRRALKFLFLEDS